MEANDAFWKILVAVTVAIVSVIVGGAAALFNALKDLTPFEGFVVLMLALFFCQLVIVPETKERKRLRHEAARDKFLNDHRGHEISRRDMPGVDVYKPQTMWSCRQCAVFYTGFRASAIERLAQDV